MWEGVERGGGEEEGVLFRLLCIFLFNPIPEMLAPAQNFLLLRRCLNHLLLCVLWPDGLVRITQSSSANTVQNTRRRPIH
jgi:hypothetical protein